MRKICYTCYRPVKSCLCPHIKPLPVADIRFVILIHPKEARKQKTGTGRLSHLCLEDSVLIEGVDFTDHKQVNRLIADSNYLSALLYPGSDSINLSEQTFDKSVLKKRKLQLFVIDGTWPCAKKMMKLSTNLHTLPRFSFTPKQRSIFTIKQQPDKMCLSTIESIYLFLNEWQKGDHSVLIDILQKLVDHQISCANDPDIPSYRKSSYRPVEQRRQSIKWEKRKIFFD